MNKYNTDIKEYLLTKGVSVKKIEGKELVVHCFVSGCDSDSKGKEAHMYVEVATGKFHCKKCNASGGPKKLMDHFGDSTKIEELKEKTKRNFSQKLIEDCANAIPERIRKYLNGRGVSDEVISKNKIGYGIFYYQNWITIPIKKSDELDYTFLVIRKDPENTNKDTPKSIFFPKGKSETSLYGEFANENEDLIICEGIIDCLSLLSLGYKAVTSTGGAGTFKDEWVDENLLKAKSIYVAYDNDDAGRSGALKVLKLLKSSKHKSLFKVTLPEIVGDKGDVNDYIVKHKLSVSELLSKYSTPYPEQIDIRQFSEIGIDELEEILSLTIKGDKENKLITFLCQLSAFTEDNQFNVMFNSPSSTGKSYTALQISNLFPKDSLMKLGNCSATAFFHDSGKYNKETNTITVDLSKKILIFTENQHYQLLEKLRSFLSHDEKVMNIKVTDKGQKGGNKTKNIELIGYTAVIFCTASLKSDPQEKTRFIILSPEISEEKTKAGIQNVILKESSKSTYGELLEKDPRRKQLILRIEAVRNAEIETIDMSTEDSKYLEESFLRQAGPLQPRHQRDVKRLIDLAKTLALLNMWFRGLDGKKIAVNRSDIDGAISLYGPISFTQNLGISPFIYEIYKDVIKPAYVEKNKNVLGDFYEGVTYQEITSLHRKLKAQKLDYNYLRQQILPELEACGLVTKEYSGIRVLVHINDYESDSQSLSSESVGGVNI